MLEDVGELGPVQLGIHRHRCKTGEPEAVEHLDVLGAVLRHDGDAVAGREDHSAPQAAGEPGRTARKFAVARHHPLATADGGSSGIGPAQPLEPEGDVHGAFKPR